MSARAEHGSNLQKEQWQGQQICLNCLVACLACVSNSFMHRMQPERCNAQLRRPSQGPQCLLPLGGYWRCQ